QRGKATRERHGATIANPADRGATALRCQKPLRGPDSGIYRGKMTRLRRSARRDGRVVDGGGLENHCTRKGTGGSNPSASASCRIVVRFCLVPNTATGARTESAALGQRRSTRRRTAN